MTLFVCRHRQRLRKLWSRWGLLMRQVRELSWSSALRSWRPTWAVHTPLSRTVFCREIPAAQSLSATDNCTLMSWDSGRTLLPSLRGEPHTNAYTVRRGYFSTRFSFNANLNIAFCNVILLLLFLPVIALQYWAVQVLKCIVALVLCTGIGYLHFIISSLILFFFSGLMSG